MNDLQRLWLRKYVNALNKHIALPNETALREAYELGRKAVDKGLGILDIAALYHDSMHQTLAADAPQDVARIDRSLDFFMESLSPFEMMLRGYQESNKSLTTMNETLRETQATLQSLLRAYERAERISSRFQEAALPQIMPRVPGFRFDAFYQAAPSDPQVGGDWYDAMRLEDGRIIISIGDVSGSGLNAAIIMVMIRQVIRGTAYIHPDPVMILNAVGKTLSAEYPDTYASAFVGIIDPLEMTLTYASAGHPPPLMHLSDGEIRELAYDGLLLGLWNSKTHTPERISLQPHSLLVLYTDGLLESEGDSGASEKRLRTIIRSRTLARKKNIAHCIHDAVLKQPARDDVAILTLTISPPPAQGISRWTFDAQNAQDAHHARKAFITTLRERCDPAEDDVYSAELVFGELVGNVLRHAQGVVEVAVDWNASAPILHVRDEGPGFSFAPRLPQDLWAENGRGLYIISHLTNDFNVTRINERGSHARAVLALKHCHAR